MLQADQIKKDFPILNRTNRYGKKLAYLDNAATTHKPNQVIDAISNFYKEHNSNIHRGIHFLGVEATEMFEEARKRIKKFIGADDDGEIVFVRGTTEGINLVANSFAKPLVKKGDRILISAMEHHSNLVPWQQVTKMNEGSLDIIPITDSGDLDLNRLDDLLTDQTKLVALTHISNSLGTINDLKMVVVEAHKKGIPVLIDGAQAAGHQAIDLKSIDCDFYAFSGHKMFGPTGIGVLYAKREHLGNMVPYQFGGEMIRSVSFEDTSFADLPHRFEAGTPDVAGVIGLAATIEYLEEIGMDNIKRHTEDLTNHLVTKLDNMKEVQVIGRPINRGSIVSFTIENAHPHDVATILDEHGVAIRAGHHCTMPLMHSLNLPGTNRASVALYNSQEDIDILCNALTDVTKIFG